MKRNRNLLITLCLLGSVLLLAAVILFLAWQAGTRWPQPNVSWQPRVALLVLIPTAYAAVAPWFQRTRLSRYVGGRNFFQEWAWDGWSFWGRD